MIVVVANTGLESEKTLEFVKKNSEYFGFECVWVEAITNPFWGKGVTAKVVTFETASRKGEPFDASNAIFTWAVGRKSLKDGLT